MIGIVSVKRVTVNSNLLFVCLCDVGLFETLQLSEKSNHNLDPFPEVDERESQKESQTSSKLSHQGLPRVKIFLEDISISKHRGPERVCARFLLPKDYVSRGQKVKSSKVTSVCRVVSEDAIQTLMKQTSFP